MHYEKVVLMSPTLIKMNIENQIDNALKDRAILFTHMEAERRYTTSWRLYQTSITRNTKKIGTLRRKWRQINKLK